MILPNIIQGPAIIKFKDYSLYCKEDIKVDYDRQTFQIMSDMHGQIDERVKSFKLIISATPVGMLNDEAIAMLYPYGPADIGASIFGGSDSPLVIHSKAGQTYTFPRAGVSKMPTLILSTQQPVFGDVQFTCLFKSATELTDAASQKTIASSAFNDATFNEDLIKTDEYAAAFGADPFDEIGSMAGFQIEIGMALEEISADDVGVAQIILGSLTGMARFAPSNLTEAQVDTLLGIQGAAAFLPGQSLAKNNTDLVIASDYFSATLHKAGPRKGTFSFGKGKHRFEGLEFTSKRTWTDGVANPLFTFEEL